MAVDEIYIGKNVSSMTESPSFLPYGRVILDVGTDSSGNTLSYTSSLSNYSASTHRTLYCECWWGSQTMADNILATVGNYTYQPFDADGALMDMSVEMGDAVTVNGLFSAINSRTYHINALSSNTISAPEDEEIDHEYPYETVADRSVTRTNATTKAELTVMSTEIQSKISSAQAQSLIDQTLETITLSVSDSSGTTTFQIKAGSTTLDTETADIHVKNLNIEGQITASQIDVTDLRVTNANIENLYASKITTGSVGGSIGTSSAPLNGMYANGVHLEDSTELWSEGQQSVYIGHQGVRDKGSSTYVAWSTIIAGGTGTATFG